MSPTETPIIVNDALTRRKRKQRIVEEHTDKTYYVCGKKTNKNVYELQQLYETTQAKTTKVLPEFLERIRFMIVKGICKATYSNSVDQNGELFNFVVEQLLNKIIPKKDEHGNLVTKYKSSKANLGAYILNSCYWSVIAYQNNEQWCESLVSCSDFMEDYEKASEMPKELTLGRLKFISSYSETSSYIPIIQDILQGDEDD